MKRIEIIKQLDAYHFLNSDDYEMYSEQIVSMFNAYDAYKLDKSVNMSIPVSVPVYEKCDDNTHFRKVESFEVQDLTLSSQSAPAIYYYEKTKSIKKYFPCFPPAAVNLIDYLEDPIIRDIVRSIVKAHYPEHSLRLLDKLEKDNVAYRVSIDTLLNPENTDIRDIVTEREKYPFPVLNNNNNLLYLMIARAARKDVTERYYQEFLNYLSSFDLPNHVYSRLKELKEMIVYSFFHNKLFKKDPDILSVQLYDRNYNLLSKPVSAIMLFRSKRDYYMQCLKKIKTAVQKNISAEEALANREQYFAIESKTNKAECDFISLNESSFENTESLSA